MFAARVCPPPISGRAVRRPGKRPGAGRVAGGAEESPARGTLAVVEVDLLVGAPGDGVAVVVAGQRPGGHEGEVAAVGGDAGGEEAKVLAAYSCLPIAEVLSGEHRDQTDGVGPEVVAVEVAFAGMDAGAWFGAITVDSAFIFGEGAVSDEVGRRPVGCGARDVTEDTGGFGRVDAVDRKVGEGAGEMARLGVLDFTHVEVGGLIGSGRARGQIPTVGEEDAPPVS